MTANTSPSSQDNGNKNKNIPTIIACIFFAIIIILLTWNLLANSKKQEDIHPNQNMTINVETDTEISENNGNVASEKNSENEENVNSQPGSAALVVDTPNKKIYLVSPQQLKQIDNNFDTSTLKLRSTWEALGFSSEDAENISQHIYDDKMANLLSKMRADEQLDLKVIMIQNPHVNKVEFGLADDDEFPGHRG